MTVNKKSAPHFAADGAVFEAAARSLDTVRAAQEGADRVLRLAEQWRNCSPEQVAGRMAEELHAATFNIDAAGNGLRTLRATTEAANGAATAAADVTITLDGRVLDQAQVKFHGTPTSTTFNVAKAKYDGMQRIVPSDQLDKVRDLADKRGVDALGQRNYPDVAANASDRIRAGGAESRPVSLNEALEAAKNPQKMAADLVGSQAATAMKRGAVTGAAVGGGLSAISNLAAFVDGDKSGEDAIVDTVADAAACGLSGAAVSGAAVVAETALVRAGAGALAGGAAPVAIGMTAVDVVKDVGRLMNGDIDGDEFAGRAVTNVAKGGCTWGGMEGGAAIGTLICPGVGTVVGGVVGGIAGSLFGGWLFD